MMVGVEALNKGKCETKDFFHPHKLEMACKESKDKKLKKTLSKNCYGNTVLCKNKDRLNELKMWLGLISSAEVAENISMIDKYNAKEMEPSISREDCVKRIALMATAKVHDIFRKRFAAIGNGIADMGGNIDEGIIIDCKDAIKSTLISMKTFLGSRLRFCSLNTKTSMRDLKQDICRQVPWSCLIKID